MRLSKQLCFLVAAAIASAVDGAPIGYVREKRITLDPLTHLSHLHLYSDKIERRQEITLELTPAQTVDVDGSRDIPTILISENGYQLGPQGCVGGNCGSYAINMPPLSQLEELMAPQTSYDPYSENYSPHPLQTYPNVPPQPIQSQIISASASPPRWTNAGWNAPLIPSGTFPQSLQGMPTLPTSTIPTSTVSAPPPVPGALQADPNLLLTAPPTGIPAPPLPLAAPVNPNGAVPAAPVPPPSDAVPPPPPPPPPAAPPASEVKDDKKVEDQPAAKKDVPLPPPPPPQRRGFRAYNSKKNTSIKLRKRSIASQHLQKRQLLLDQEPSTTDSTLNKCESGQIKKVEVLIPVTEAELAALQEGSVELISYPSVGLDGSEETLYDVLPVSHPPTKIEPSLKEIFENSPLKRSEPSTSPGSENNTEEHVTPRSRSLNTDNLEAPTFNTLDKRLKYGEKKEDSFQ